MSRHDLHGWRLPYGMMLTAGRELIVFDRGYCPLLVIDRNGDNQRPTTDRLPLQQWYIYWFYDAVLHKRDLPEIEAIWEGFKLGTDMQFDVVDSRKRLIKRRKEA